LPQRGSQLGQPWQRQRAVWKTPPIETVCHAALPAGGPPAGPRPAADAGKLGCKHAHLASRSYCSFTLNAPLCAGLPSLPSLAGSLPYGREDRWQSLPRRPDLSPCQPPLPAGPRLHAAQGRVDAGDFRGQLGPSPAGMRGGPGCPCGWRTCCRRPCCRRSGCPCSGRTAGRGRRA